MVRVCQRPYQIAIHSCKEAGDGIESSNDSGAYPNAAEKGEQHLPEQKRQQNGYKGRH